VNQNGGVNVQNREEALVKVLEVRLQSKFGVIFRGQRITSNGEILDTHNQLVVRVFQRDLSVPVMPGQWWNVGGKVVTRRFVNNRGFEMTEHQLEVDQGQYRMIMPSGSHVVDYLTRNPRFRGIGKISAERLWEAFQESLYDILDAGDADRLAEVVKEKKASILVAIWQEEGLASTLQWLHAHDIGLKIGRRVLDYFGKEAANKIEENPYRLLSFSADWQEVDVFARNNLQVEPHDERRLQAAVEETVYRHFSRGNTIVARKDLVAGLRDILKGELHTRELIEKAIEHCRMTGRLLFDHEGNAFSFGAAILENNVVDCISLRQGKKSKPCDVDRIIRAYEDREGYDFKLNKEQRQAVHLVAENEFAVVTGGAGVGKTTVLKCVFDVLDTQGYNVTQLALAGKAVKRMMQATGRPAFTIASFIKSMKKLEGQAEGGASGKRALVVDEASMVDLISFSAIVRLIDDDTKIVMVGDPHQLPPVGPGLILHCLTNIHGIPHVELKVPMRFGDEIAEIANTVKDGVFPGVEQFNQSVRFIEVHEYDMGEMGSKLYLECPDDSVVLCATRKIAHTINLRIQETLKKNKKPLRLFNVEEDVWEHLGFFEGDMLICTQNHWDLGIQNGSIGQLVEIFEEPISLDDDDECDSPALGFIEWDDGVVRPLREDLLDSLELGYALTVHKSQGSQWKRVIVCLPNKSGSKKSKIDRSLVYTAITRAQKEGIICGQHKHLVQAVMREKEADRRKIGLPMRLAQRNI